MEIRLLFANHIPLPAKTPEGNSNTGTEKPKLDFPWNVLWEQLINSFIIAAIAGLSTFTATGSEAGAGKAAGIAFGITFFVEMRKYRKI